MKIENLEKGVGIVKASPLFSKMGGFLQSLDSRVLGKENAGLVTREGTIFLNKDYFLSPDQWAYVIAHGMLHLAFGHFDQEKMPPYAGREAGDIQEMPRGLPTKESQYLWNMACDMYIAKFLADIKFGQPICPNPAEALGISLTDEVKLYMWLAEHKEKKLRAAVSQKPIMENIYGTTSSGLDMRGLEKPLVYQKEKNRYMVQFAYALSSTVTDTVGKAGGHTGAEKMTKSKKAAQWFISHYPLFGGLAASFRIVEDYAYCIREEIQIAAVDISLGEIYVNPTAGLHEEELKFVLAHEFLHAGLAHQERQAGRDAYLWNVACDYVINSWLVEMKIGQMPELGLLYDAALKNKSAEEIYDLILADIRKYQKMGTFCGYGKGDILKKKRGIPSFSKSSAEGWSMEEFCKSALQQGLEYHQSSGRGYLPAGLLEEIRALSMPPVPWDVELARWFDEQFPYMEKKRTYARPSRRQGATPDIPRPRYVLEEALADGRTFGVVIDTSASMSTKLLGMALGSIASYAAMREVPLVRVIFCDAAAYDVGYLTPEEVASRVEVKGRGGTKLQPGVDALEAAEDFPKNGPVLLITDGEIEPRMTIRREHAFLIPKGKRLPFRARGKVFYFS